MLHHDEDLLGLTYDTAYCKQTVSTSHRRHLRTHHPATLFGKYTFKCCVCYEGAEPNMPRTRTTCLCPRQPGVLEHVLWGEGICKICSLACDSPIHHLYPLLYFRGPCRVYILYNIKYYSILLSTRPGDVLKHSYFRRNHSFSPHLLWCQVSGAGRSGRVEVFVEGDRIFCPSCRRALV